jgi:DNA-binding MarR family transcriptional regulator
VNEIIWLLFRLANRFSELEKTPVSFGTGEVLYPSEIHMIEAIGKNRGRTVTELCGRFGITKGAVSQTIGKLAAKGYIKKVRNADFGKEVLLSLTKKAKGRSAPMKTA